MVASRPPETALAPELAARTLARLTGAPGAVRQHLGALTADQVAAVLAQVYPDGPVDRQLVETVRERTGGNPYRLTELIATRGGHGPDGLVGEPSPEHLSVPPEPIGAELTAREVEVLGCLAAGMSNKQVARSLGISVRTVTVHVSNLLRKTGSASRTEAALWAVRRQLTGPSQSV